MNIDDELYKINESIINNNKYDQKKYIDILKIISKNRNIYKNKLTEYIKYKDNLLCKIIKSDQTDINNISDILILSYSILYRLFHRKTNDIKILTINDIKLLQRNITNQTHDISKNYPGKKDIIEIIKLIDKKINIKFNNKIQSTIVDVIGYNASQRLLKEKAKKEKIIKNKITEKYNSNQMIDQNNLNETIKEEYNVNQQILKKEFIDCITQLCNKSISSNKGKPEIYYLLKLATFNRDAYIEHFVYKIFVMNKYKFKSLTNLLNNIINYYESKDLKFKLNSNNHSYNFFIDKLIIFINQHIFDTNSPVSEFNYKYKTKQLNYTKNNKNYNCKRYIDYIKKIIKILNNKKQCIFDKNMIKKNYSHYEKKSYTNTNIKKFLNKYCFTKKQLDSDCIENDKFNLEKYLSYKYITK